MVDKMCKILGKFFKYCLDKAEEKIPEETINPVSAKLDKDIYGEWLFGGGDNS